MSWAVRKRVRLWHGGLRLAALEQAEYYASRLAGSEQFRWMLLIASDLALDPGERVANNSEALHFPPGTVATAAFVAERRGAADFKACVTWWTRWLNDSGLQIEPQFFLPPSASQDGENLAALIRREPAQVAAGDQGVPVQGDWTSPWSRSPLACWSCQDARPEASAGAPLLPGCIWSRP